MKRIGLFIIILMLCNQVMASTVVTQSYSKKKIVVKSDTVFVDNTPYCLIKKVEDTYTISTLEINEILYIQTISKDETKYYQISISPLRKNYYAKKSDVSIKALINDVVKHQLVDDGFFNAYGANMLIKECLQSKRFITSADLPMINNTNQILKQSISWKKTDNADSTVILSGGEPIAYYTKRHWREYGVNRFRTLIETESEYRYFIYNIIDDTPLAEVRIADWWETKTTITTPDGWTFQFKNISNTDDIMRVAAKLILVREAQK